MATTATISFSDALPEDIKGTVRFSFPATEFDLDVGKSTTTEDPDVLSSAAQHPWLKVTDVKVDTDNAPDPYDPNDPHDNPAADHLSVSASPEAKEAAAAERAQVLEETGAPAPDVEEAATVQTTAAKASTQDEPGVPATQTTSTSGENS